MMLRLLASLILPVAALTGCGEVVVFGHVVREDPAKTEAAAQKPATEQATSKPTTEAAASQSATEAVASNPPADEAVASKPAAEETVAPNPATATESTHAAPQTSSPAATAVPAAHVLHAVNVTVSPASQAGDAGVDAAALLDAIRAELKSRKLLDEQNPSADGTAEVLIDSAAMHPTVNAVIFGQRPMAGTITGEVRLSSASGEELPTSRIVAESRFTITDDGQNQNALGPLYRRFAVLTADELTTAKPNKDAGRQPQKP
jgi:hypothetical protein